MSTTPSEPQEPEREPGPGSEPRPTPEGESAPEPERRDRQPEPPQQSPYPQQPQQPQQPPYQAPQDQPPYGQTPYGQPSPGQQADGGAQYGAGPYSAGPYGAPYQTVPPAPPYGQPYGGQPSDLPAGMPPLADWGQRAAAFVLDNGPVIVSGWIAGATRSDAVDVVFGIIAFLGLVWAIGNAVRAGRTGQSFGKQTLGIRLARFVDGRPVGVALALLRLFLNWLFWVACIIPGVLNLLWPLWNRKHQTWSDKIAGSVVVKTR